MLFNCGKPWLGSVIRHARPDTPQANQTHQRPHAFEQDETVLALKDRDGGQDYRAHEIHYLIREARSAKATKLGSAKRNQDEECSENTNSLSHRKPSVSGEARRC